MSGLIVDLIQRYSNHAMSGHRTIRGRWTHFYLHLQIWSAFLSYLKHGLSLLMFSSVSEALVCFGWYYELSQALRLLPAHHVVNFKEHSFPPPFPSSWHLAMLALCLLSCFCCKF